MTRTEMMKKAHAMTRATLRKGDDYRVTFGACLKLVWTVARLESLRGVVSAQLWTKVPGKERIYVELSKQNGGRTWNGGTGNTIIVHLATGRVEDTKRWAGAATARHHEDIGTLERIERIAA